MDAGRGSPPAVVPMLAWATVAGTFLLILAGGLVTNTGSGLAVPDWPTTFGYPMFLYPWSKMVGGIFYEHSHRLLGSLVGLLTVGLAVAIWVTDRRRWLRALATVAVGLVVIQGVLGGLRVLLLRDAIAIVHGCLAHAFFALVVGLAVVTSRRWRDGASFPGLPNVRTLAAVGVAVAYLQIALGALVTHLGRIDLHLIGAIAVVAVLPIVSARARATGQPVAVGLAQALMILLVVQLGLGLGAYLARFSGVAVPGGQAAMLALPVVHRLMGALILVTVLAMFLWALKPPTLAAASPLVHPPALPTLIEGSRS